MTATRLLWTPLTVALACGLAGCLTPDATTRPQSDDAAGPSARAVGEAASFANLQPVPISGVGLVIGLPGTGGPAPAGTYRSMLEQELKRRQIEHVRDVLDSKNHALVLVSGFIPAGVKKGDMIDVEVTLPPGSQASDLRGGFLSETVLVDFNTSGNLSPASAQAKGNKLLLGDELAVVEGPLMPPLSGLKEGDKTEGAEPGAAVKKARVWGCCKVKKDRPLYVAMNTGHARYAEAMRVANRLNQTFAGQVAASDMVAEAKTKEYVTLKVPHQYRLNLPRYMRVVKHVSLVPISEVAAERQQIGRELLDPATCLTAALKLEGFGASAVPLLEPGLKEDSPLVRFAAAEALAYLGRTSGVEELGALAVTEPTLQAYCLTALASMDEARCHAKLTELLGASAPEARYGAFRALRMIDERSDLARGERLAESFHVHRVAPETPGMAHLLTSRRPELVLFGTPKLVAPFSYVVGDLTVTAGAEDAKVTVSRFSAERGKKQVQCGFEVYDVVKELAALGAGYPEVADVLAQAQRCKGLDCALAIDALPKSASVQEIAARGRVSGLPDPEPTATVSAEAKPGLFE